MSWISVVSAGLAIIRALIQWAHDRGTIDAATAEAALKGLRDADTAISRAQAARQLLDAAIAHDGDSRLQDDGFRRPDGK